jgi:lysyl endopeptidase
LKSLSAEPSGHALIEMRGEPSCLDTQGRLQIQGDSMRTVRLSVLLAVTATLGATAAAGLSGIGDAHAASTVISVPPAVYRPPAVAPKSAPAVLAPAATVRRVVLAEPSASERGILKSKNQGTANARLVGRANPGKSRPLVVGFPRALPADARAIMLSDLSWQAQADGSRTARIEVTSPGASAVRVALAIPSVHPDLSLKFAGNGARADVMGPYPVNAVAEAATRDGLFWTPVLEGDTAIIELHAVNGASFDRIALVMGPLSHLVVAGDTLQRADTKREIDIDSAESCNIDFACVTPPSAPLTQAMNSVGKLVFNDRAGFTYLCTGTMLNDSTTSFTPYVFTANHCIRDDAAFMASTLNVYWFFRAQTCGSLAPPPYALQTGGAMLLARSDDWDWMLLRLNAAPPAGVTFTAWRAEPVPEGAIATGLHHPGGDLGKFSQGNTTGYQLFSDGSSFIRMQWSQGTTETGSSGSGLFTFLQSGGYYEVRGGLFGGDASCSFRDGNDYYSRLDNMLPLTRQYLTPDAANPTGQAVAVEYYHRDLDHFFITTDPNEINLLDTGVIRGWVRTGIRFLAYNVPTPGTNPVCRFYLRPGVGDSHFYSGDPNECAQTLARFGASWIYESPSVFYIALPNPVTGACPSGTIPIWRFFNSVVTNHRYTPEVTIRDELRNDPRWVAEGYGPDSVIMCAAASN